MVKGQISIKPKLTIQTHYSNLCTIINNEFSLSKIEHAFLIYHNSVYTFIY